MALPLLYRYSIGVNLSMSASLISGNVTFPLTSGWQPSTAETCPVPGMPLGIARFRTGASAVPVSQARANSSDEMVSISPSVRTGEMPSSPLGRTNVRLLGSAQEIRISGGSPGALAIAVGSTVQMLAMSLISSASDIAALASARTCSPARLRSLSAFTRTSSAVCRSLSACTRRISAALRSCSAAARSRSSLSRVRSLSARAVSACARVVSASARRLSASCLSRSASRRSVSTWLRTVSACLRARSASCLDLSACSLAASSETLASSPDLRSVSASPRSCSCDARSCSVAYIMILVS